MKRITWSKKITPLNTVIVGVVTFAIGMGLKKIGLTIPAFFVEPLGSLFFMAGLFGLIAAIFSKEVGFLITKWILIILGSLLILAVITPSILNLISSNVEKSETTSGKETLRNMSDVDFRAKYTSGCANSSPEDSTEGLDYNAYCSCVVDEGLKIMTRDEFIKADQEMAKKDANIENSPLNVPVTLCLRAQNFEV